MPRTTFARHAVGTALLVAGLAALLLQLAPSGDARRAGAGDLAAVPAVVTTQDEGR